MNNICAEIHLHPNLDPYSLDENNEKQKVIIDKIRNGKMRRCPNDKCKIFTEKISGNNLILCRCGTKWCWECGDDKKLCNNPSHNSG